MKRIQLLTLAALLGVGGCYGGDSEQVLNPYELNKKQPLVQAPTADDQEPPAAESPQQSEDLANSPASGRAALPDPDRYSPAPEPTDLAETTAPAEPSYEPSAIDPRLRGGADGRDSRYEPIRPRTAEPAESASEPTPPIPAPAVEEVPAPQIVTDDVPQPGDASAEPAEPSQPPSEEPTLADDSPRPPQPAATDLAIDQPGNLTIPENIPSIADTPPSLVAPEMESANKPPLPEVPSPEAEGLAPATAEEPAARQPRPSDLLLGDVEQAGGEAVVEEPAAEEAPAEAAEPEAAPPAESLPLDEASQLRNWTDSTGRLEIKARFIKFDGNDVILRSKTGETLRIPLERFSRSDREFLQQIKRGDLGI